MSSRNDQSVAIPAPVLDHVVVNVKGDLEASVETYRRLGFSLTERGHHSLGSSNHLAIFGENYLELLGYEAGKSTVRPDVMQAPLGLTGLAFKTQDSHALHAGLQARGVTSQAPAEFFRPVNLPDGTTQDARFSTVRLATELVRNGRTFFCHHFTPEHVWRDEWREHPNGVTDIVGYVIATPNPAITAALYDRVFGPGVLTALGQDGYALQASQARVEFVTPAEAERRFGEVETTEDGSERGVALILRTRSLAQVLATLKESRIPSTTLADGSVLVTAAEGFHVALQFIEGE
ncbi:VOC family protein [Pandoraea pneumonica]|uniref:VOC family protein n=1 Tax=Pandoraea pneumonica TaxID=2508299 RepID=UPI003CF9C4B4